MLQVGLTGGLATGKTFVARTLRDLGCHVLSSDALGHKVLEPGGEAYPKVIEAFGDEILNENREIDRKRLGSIVFSDPARLELLNSFVHPAVIAQQIAWLEDIARLDPDAIAVVEAAILIETGSHRRFEKLILTVCSVEQQIARAMDRDGLSRSEVERRLERQMPLEEKRKYADYVVDTSGPKEATVTQVVGIYRMLRSLKQ